MIIAYKGSLIKIRMCTKRDLGTFPSPHDIGDFPVVDAEETIKYSLRYQLRRHNDVAEISVSPARNAEPHRALKEPCSHEYVTKWKCDACGKRLQNFGNFLDSGQHTHFLKIERVSSAPFVFRTRIYSAYRPSDVVELREYMMVLLSSALSEYDEGFRVEKPRLSRKLSYYLTTRYDGWEFYARRYLPKKVLKFDGMFESGNLDGVELVDADQYWITVTPDTNTSDYVQWFYFSVSNTTAGKVVSFKILNLVKRRTLYSQGMRIWVFSRQKYRLDHIGWHTGGAAVYYSENNYPRPGHTISGKSANYFTLSFEHAFEYSDDEVFFAFAHPYQYTRTCYFVHDVEVFPRAARSTIGATIAAAGGRDQRVQKQI